MAQLAPPELVQTVGIGTRVRMVFRDIAPGLSLPQWTIDETAPQPVPWRYPGGLTGLAYSAFRPAALASALQRARSFLINSVTAAGEPGNIS